MEFFSPEVTKIEEEIGHKYHFDATRHNFQIYGICEDCQEPISPARLHALPFARRCVVCQEQFELFEHIVRKEDREEI